MLAVFLAPLASLIAIVKRYLVLGAVGVIALGLAYSKGRIDGRSFERAAAMAAAEQVRKADEVARAELENDNRREIETEISREATNDEIEAHILRPASSDSSPAFDGEFMHNLGRLR